MGRTIPDSDSKSVSAAPPRRDAERADPGEDLAPAPRTFQPSVEVAADSAKREERARPHGISAFVRCQNEEEYIVASLLSIERCVDEIVVILNNSTDSTRALVEDLMSDRPKIRLLHYDAMCEPSGVGYLDRVRTRPAGSLATYYNWCMEQTRFSHVCKWDGDMIALPPFSRAKDLILTHDVVLFDGYDLVGAYTTDMEPRIFRFDPPHTRYVDWDLYEVLNHRFSKLSRLEEKCFLHMKLGKRAWLHRDWACPNDFATSSPPPTGAQGGGQLGLRRFLTRLAGVFRVLASRSSRDES